MHRRLEHKILVKKKQMPFGRNSRNWEDDIKADITGTSRDDAVLV
jgi:hypothetical protein